jgi:tetratricopeptide (TPR) repeat protein
LDAPLPQFPESVHTERVALNAFRSAVASSRLFSLHEETRDLGTDVQVAPLLFSETGQSATNFRVHIQVKGTETEPNVDDTVSYPFASSTLNYLLGQPLSQLVVYHLPTQRLLVSSVDQVIRILEHQEKSLGTQQTVTVRFSQPFDHTYQQRLHGLAMATGTRSTVERHGWITTPPEDVGPRYRRAVRPISLPDDPVAAHQMVKALLKEGEDRAISAHFEEYRAVCGEYPDLMLTAYLAETNLALTGLPADKHRIRDGLEILESTQDQWEASCIYWYTRGNLLNALGKAEAARLTYMYACDLAEDYPGIEAQALVNMANTLTEEPGGAEAAIAALERALELDPTLQQAHASLGRLLLEGGRAEDAAQHFAAALEYDPLPHQVAGFRFWRARALLETGRVDEGFSEIRQGLSTGKDQPWVWPHLGHILFTLGARSPEAAIHAIPLWDRYLARDDSSSARFGRIMCLLKLDIERMRTLPGYGDFTGEDLPQEVDALLANEGRSDRIARANDQLGHWHQGMGNWPEAERRFRRAWELDPETYGACLGTSLLFLERFAEAAKVLSAYVRVHPEDGRGWHQLGVAQLEMGVLDSAIESLQRAIEIDPEYTHAWANLIGALDLSDRTAEAWQMCEDGLRRFGEHEHLVKARDQLLDPRFRSADPGDPPPDF